MSSAAQRLGADPSLLSVDEIAAYLATDPRRGLTVGEAAARLRRFGSNELAAAPPVPVWRRLLGQLADPLVYLLMFGVAISLIAWVVEGAAGFPFDAAVIAVIVGGNAMLGYLQEARAEAAVAALQRMAAPRATVIRDGAEIEVPAATVVPGDVLVLAEGEAISADGRLIEAPGLTVTEAALTGESQPSLKDAAALAEPAALADRVNMVFGGTAVTSGRGRAVVTSTGMATEVGRIALLLARTPQEPTPLQREVARLGRVLGLAVVVIAGVVVGTILLAGRVDSASAAVDVLLIGVSLAVAAVPEGLPAVLSVVLAIGVQRMARRNAVVKTLSSVETLGSASVVCSDKTGTLTRNEMMIRRVVTASGEVEVTGVGYRPDGELRVDGRPAHDAALLDEVRAVLAGGSMASNATLSRSEDGSWTVRGDPTEGAFLAAEAKVPLLRQQRRDRFRRVAEVPFTSERKLMSSIEGDTARGGLLAIVTKGAPDVLLHHCSREQAAGQVRPLTGRRRERILADVDRLAEQGLRTLAVAYRPLQTVVPPADREALERDLIFVGMVGIADPPRPEAAPAVAEARRAGVRVVMITGDHPHTATRIAAELGIIDPGEQAVTGAQLDRLDGESLRRTVRDRSVYARVAPEHKLRLVDALQAEGNIVAVTGDGVNDAPALKSADIGVAMGRTGTDVAREAARMILTDDNFATIVAAIREGRGIFSNIRKFLRYLLSSNLGEVLTMLLGVVFAGAIGLAQAGVGIAVPLLATQILWINLLTDSGPALAMGMEAPSVDAMRRPPRRLTERVIDAEMQRGVVFIGLVMAVATLLTLDMYLPGGLLDGSSDLTTARTAAFTTLVLAQLFNCFNARSDRASAFRRLFTNRLLWAAIGVSLLLQIAVVHLPLLNDAFTTAPLSPGQWVVCTVLASTVLWADELRKMAVRALARR